MKSLHILLLCCISVIANANPQSEQTNYQQQPDPESIDRMWRQHQERHKAFEQAQPESSANNAISTANNKDRFTPEFVNILMKNVPESLRLKLSMLQSVQCPQDKKPKFILLHGPSGSGKTTMAELIAQQTQRHYIRVNVANIGNELINSTLSNFKRMIELHLNKPCVIVLDEIDYAIREAGSQHDPERKLPQQFWSMFDELASNPNVLIIGTTNDMSNLPAQIKTRFADSLIEISDAKPEIKTEILAYYIKQYSNNCDEAFLKKLANNYKELSIRELEKVVNVAWSKAFGRNAASINISKKDVEDSAKELKKARESMKKEKTKRQENIEKAETAGWVALGGLAGYHIGCLILESKGYPCSKK